MADRFDREIYSSLPGNAVEYIEQVVRKVRYRRGVRGEIRSELAGHFEDALQDITDQQERQRAAGQLIERFGEPGVLAVLMRRAKKRNRPAWKKAVLFTFKAFAIFMVLFSLYTVWFMSGRANPTVDYVAKLNSAVRVDVSDENNAWINYQRGLELMTKPDESTKQLLRKRLAELSPDEKMQIEAFVSANEASLAEFIQGSRKIISKEYERPEGDWLMGVMLPDLAGFRRAAYMMRLRAEMALEEGDFETAVENISAILRMGRHHQGATTIVEQLVGVSISALGLEEIRHLVARGSLDIEHLQELSLVFSNVFENDIRLRVLGEKYTFFDTLQRVFTDSGIGGGHLAVHDFPVHWKLIVGHNRSEGPAVFWAVFGMYQARRDATEAKAHQFYDKVEMAAQLTPYQRYQQGINFAEDLEELSMRYILISALAPAYERAMNLYARMEAHYKSVRAIVAIKLYELEMGHLPGSLEELVEAGYLDLVPMDPFGPGALSYRVVGDEFVLYSFGYNLVDNGGEFTHLSSGELDMYPENGDFVFWPVVD